MTTQFRLSATAVALAALCSGAQAVDFDAGDVHMTIGGIVNAYYTDARCTGSQSIGGLALAGETLGCNGRQSSTTVGNGLLPNALITTAKMRQEGIDIGATVTIGYAVANTSNIGNNSNVDVRQGFMTFGTPEAGTVKIGRDYGYFGQNVILGDMTLLGAGVPTKATQANRVTLGHIGAGYSYLGTYGMIAYETPNAAGFHANVAVISPVDDQNFQDSYQAGRRPQLQALLTYLLPESMGKVWVGGKWQRFLPVDGLTPAASIDGRADYFNATGLEGGFSLKLGDFGLLGNYQYGHGIGILEEADSGRAKQANYLVQATYQIEKFKLGVNYGQSRLRDNSLGLGTDLKTNENLTGGIYYSLTKSLTLVGEVSETRSHSFADDRANLRGISAGAILFF